MQEVHENLIRITETKLAGKLPDPFLFDDGHRMCDPTEWEARRREIYKTAVELQYGEQPPAPEFLRVEYLYRGTASDTFRVVTGTRACPITFLMRLFFPKDVPAPWPVAVDGDLCFDYAFDPAFRSPMTEHGIAYAIFNRVEIAHDNRKENERVGQIYDTYPDGKFGSIAAWAWGYSRALDALFSLGCVDPSCVAFTGHSRGAKTAMLAGVLDERATIVNPNETNAGSCSCYRFYMKAIREDGAEKESETGKALVTRFPFWLGEKMADYMDHPETLPFDAHFLKAMVAPRVLLIGEAASDIWTNPVGSWETTLAAKEVFDYLGAGDNLYWYFRRGYHAHLPEDVEALVGVMERVRRGAPVPSGFFRTPFPPQPLFFDWRKPQ